MLLAAVAHHYVFTYKAYVPENSAPQALGYKDALTLIFDVSDIRKDLKEFSGVIGKLFNIHVKIFKYLW